MRKPWELWQWRQLAVDFTLLCFYAWFVVAHISALGAGARPEIVWPMVAYESLLATIVCARHFGTTSRAPVDWIIAAIGTLAPLMMRVQIRPGMLADVGVGLQISGLCWTIVSLAVLGRRFGIVAGYRGSLAARGPYRIVRHPMYLGHLVTIAGYVLASPTGRNVWLAAVTAAMLVCRIHAEEMWLQVATCHDPRTNRGMRWLWLPSKYEEYRATVRWRLLPGIW